MCGKTSMLFKLWRAANNRTYTGSSREISLENRKESALSFAAKRRVNAAKGFAFQLIVELLTCTQDTLIWVWKIWWNSKKNMTAFIAVSIGLNCISTTWGKRGQNRSAERLSKFQILRSPCWMGCCIKGEDVFDENNDIRFRLRAECCQCANFFHCPCDSC